MPKVSSNTAVRPQIKNMVSPGTDEDFEKNLPLSTAQTETAAEPEKKTRKPYTKRAKAEPETETDPLMSDPRYAAIVGEMSSMGGKEIVALACRASGKPMDAKEEKKVDDTFYVIARKGEFNPANSWISLLIYALVVALQLALARTDIVEKIKALFEHAGEQPAIAGQVPVAGAPEPKDSIGE
jgi:hypothetical protein